MDDSKAQRAYRHLGIQLKAMRNRASETMAETSGAVEIDVKDLAKFELGQLRPSEEVLLLLISHFGAKDDEALRLWELAGYTTEKVPVAHLANAETILDSGPAPDKSILFTDVVDVVVNNYGVVMNFMQNNGIASQPKAVARVGMSREHAKSVLKILQVTLAQTEQQALKLPKRIITPDSDSK